MRMECSGIKNHNLIKFLPIQEKDKVLFVDSMEAVPKESPESYDWIFVLYYGEKEQEAPMLKRLLLMLTDKGRLYLAAENPFSLHRIAGEAEEDGSFLKAFLPDGFENCSGLSLAFLTTQVKDALKALGKEYSLKMYYPYPDIAFPSAVYTDEYLPKPGECDENFYNFHSARFCFFDEMQAVDEVVKAGMYPQFAPGYFLEIAKENTDIIYCRYSVERDQSKKICTTILQNKNGEKIVQKTAFDREANEHIKRLTEFEKKLSAGLEGTSFLKKPLVINKITESTQVNGKEQASFSFVKGKSLENHLDDYLKAGDFFSCKKTLLEFCSLIKQLPGQKPFFVTEEFKSVFGNIEPKQFQNRVDEGTMMSLPITDIDMVCQNILLGEQITLIDYEWTFDFPVPIDYLIYRVLFCYLEQKNRRKLSCFDNELDFYGKMGISYERKKLFAQMEVYFQKYAQGSCRLLRDQYLDEGKPVIPMGQLIRLLEQAQKNSVKVQYDLGQGFLEENSFYKTPAIEEDGTLSFVLDLTEDSFPKAVRFFFGTENTIVRIGLLQEDETGSKELSYETNGVQINPILYLYKEQPCVCTAHLEPGVKRLYISFHVKKLPEVFVNEMIQSLSEMREVIANREEQIQNYENSTSWKITKPLRELGRKK